MLFFFYVKIWKQTNAHTNHANDAPRPSKSAAQASPPYSLATRVPYGGQVLLYAYACICGLSTPTSSVLPDFAGVRNIEGYPLRFVMIKSTEGSSRTDNKFKENFRQAREHGLIRGAYHFWSNKSSARDQAYFFLKQVRLENGDLPPVLDVEHKPQDRNVEDFQRDILTWLHIVEDKYHVKPIIYTYYKFKENYLDAPVFDDYPYWIAHYYVDKVEYKGTWHFWQHTDAGKLPGIKGYVDFNIFNGSFYALKKLTIGNQD